MSTLFNIILAASLLLLCVWGTVIFRKIKKQRRIVAALYADREYCAACLSLCRAFAKIRHDFANYVQAMQLPLDAGGMEQTKEQRQAIRKLIVQWMDERAAFIKMSDRQIWN